MQERRHRRRLRRSRWSGFPYRLLQSNISLGGGRMDEATTARVGYALRAWVDKRREQAAASAFGGRAQEGRRSSVTGGLHLQALNQLVVDEVRSTGAKALVMLKNQAATLPGYYRPSKAWDLVVLRESLPILAVEYKSMSGSEGKNLNNRSDEIFGMAEDARQAEKEGLIAPNLRRAYIFVMAMTSESTRPVGVPAVLGKADPAFVGASYLQRTAI